MLSLLNCSTGCLANALQNGLCISADQFVSQKSSAALNRLRHGGVSSKNLGQVAPVLHE